MSNFPNQIDDDTTLPPVNDNITEDGGEAINAARDAIINIELNIGIGAAGTAGSIAARLAASLNPDGSIMPSAINSLSLDYTQIRIADEQVLPYAGIQESKLSLAYTTTTLYNYFLDLSRSVNTALSWIDITGVELQPHIAGILYRHDLTAIDVNDNVALYLLNRFGLLRNNTNAYTLVNDINNDFIAHEIADGTVFGSLSITTTPSGITFPSAYAHVANGIYLNTSNFSIIPHSATDLQQFAEFVDSANTFLLGTKTQTFWQSGIARSARSTVIGNNSKGLSVVPPTLAQTFLSTASPNDSPFPPYGDDVILFTPTTGNLFLSQLASVRPGDIATINYGSVIISALVKEINPSGNLIRIAGKNITSTTTATVDISRSLDNTNKYGVLAPAIAPSPAPSSSMPSSLIVGSPRAAQATGIGFNASLFDSSHYNLYLQLYPNGNPNNAIVNMVVIDVTGNQGTTPGAYTLDYIVQNINTQFRKAGYNFRFIAFEYEGDFGIMLADPYGGAAFSITAGVVNASGSYDPTLTTTLYPKNVVDVINGIDPLGMGPGGANWASPSFTSGFSSAAAALIPTVVISPLQGNFYFVNGGESDRFAVDAQQLLDVGGNSYWAATIIAKTISGGTIHTTYQINENLTESRLAPGKTLVVQPVTVGAPYPTDYGRFTIQNVVFNATCAPDGYTNITVYDAVSGTGISPYLTSGVGTAVNIYFNSDSVGFNSENVNDIDGYVIHATPFKRQFEVYIDQDGYTFSYERARFSLNNAANNASMNPLNVGSINGYQLFVGNTSELNSFNIIDVSPKLTGYAFNNGTGTTITKINLQITSFTTTTGIYTGYLRRDPTDTDTGPLTTGKVGEVTRFYDATYVDYIDLELPLGSSLSATPSGPADTYGMDIQIYPSLRLNDELLLISTCQYNDSSNLVDYLEDRRQFGNTSEKQFSDSAFDYINSNARYTQQNGVVRGFDCTNPTPSPNTNLVSFRGGLALVDGGFLAINPFTVEVPIVKDYNGGTPTTGVLFALCINSESETVLLPLTDFDPSVNAIDNPGRLLVLFNLANSLSYPVDSSIFTTLISDRKDLTILYLLAMSATSTSSYTVTIQDARKYVVDADSSIRPTLTDQATQGNFQSFYSALTWFKYNSSYQNTLHIKSAYPAGITLSDDPLLASNTNLINIVGDGTDASLYFTPGVTLNFVNFDSVFLTFNSASTLSNNRISNSFITPNGGMSFSSSTFTGCVINASGANTISSGSFSNCTFNVSGSLTVTGGEFFNCVINPTSTNNIGNATFINCTFPCTIPLSVIGDCSFDGCTFNVGAPNTSEMLNISGTSYVTITDGYFHRGATSLASYINVGASVVGIVTGNAFDHNTINGSNHALISGTISGLQISSNINYYDTYTYPSGSLITAATGSSTFYATGSIVTGAAISKTIVQPLVWADQSGRTAATLLPNTGYAGVENMTSSIGAYILTNLVNGATCGSCYMMASCPAGTQAGDSVFYTYKTNVNTGVMTQIAGPDGGPMSGSGTGLQQFGLGITGVVIDTTQYTYHILIAGDSVASSRWYPPVMVFSYSPNIYPPQ